MHLCNKSVLGRCIDFALDRFDIWVFPIILLAAWVYYPYCQAGPNLCIWRALFHKPCLGCGLTRGVCFLVHGRLRDAIRLNPLSIVFVLSMSVAFSKAVGELWRAGQGQRSPARRLFP
jgi:hypothetical protein